MLVNHGLRVVLLSYFLVFDAACEDSNKEEHPQDTRDTGSDKPDSGSSGRPETFGLSCNPAVTVTCKQPFSCHPTMHDTAGGWCTKSCETTADCPAWQESGHCAGSKQSMCVDLVCVPIRCK